MFKQTGASTDTKVAVLEEKVSIYEQMMKKIEDATLEIPVRRATNTATTTQTTTPSPTGTVTRTPTPTLTSTITGTPHSTDSFQQDLHIENLGLLHTSAKNDVQEARELVASSLEELEFNSLNFCL